MKVAAKRFFAGGPEGPDFPLIRFHFPGFCKKPLGSKMPRAPANPADHRLRRHRFPIEFFTGLEKKTETRALPRREAPSFLLVSD